MTLLSTSIQFCDQTLTCLGLSLRFVAIVDTGCIATANEDFLKCLFCHVVAAWIFLVRRQHNRWLLGEMTESDHLRRG